MLPWIMAIIVGVSLAAYAIEALSAIGDFSDPHDWMVDDDEEE